MYIESIEKSMYDLICETSTNLPKDVRRAILSAKEKKQRYELRYESRYYR